MVKPDLKDILISDYYHVLLPLTFSRIKESHMINVQRVKGGKRAELQTKMTQVCEQSIHNSHNHFIHLQRKQLSFTQLQWLSAQLYQLYHYNINYCAFYNTRTTKIFCNFIKRSFCPFPIAQNSNNSHEWCQFSIWTITERQSRTFTLTLHVCLALWYPFVFWGAISSSHDILTNIVDQRPNC